MTDATWLTGASWWFVWGFYVLVCFYNTANIEALIIALVTVLVFQQVYTYSVEPSSKTYMFLFLKSSEICLKL